MCANEPRRLRLYQCRRDAIMSKYAIQVEGLGKEYIIGGAEQRHETFREMLTGALTSPLRKLRKLGGNVNDVERFWALKDVSFNVEQGEVLGIIGRNGAGKSTLLKVLSKVTSPTEGRVMTRGRMSSLLEVGTGFHPELSGRENIYLNGAILGMSRKEVARKFDEIVAFAEMEKFIDTPVKRYSSGMYVRLAFAVAAHLETDILVVDEVLAVGDAEFQKRCLGKMKEVSSGGRTVLFVSHNTTAIQTLCSECVLLDHGKIESAGITDVVIDRYLAHMQMGLGMVHSDMKCISLHSVDAEYRLLKHSECSITVQLEFQSSISVADLHIDFGMENSDGVRLLQVMPSMRGELPNSILADSGFSYRIQWDSTELAPGEYFCTVYAHSKSLGVLLHLSNIRLFRVPSSEANRECMLTGFTSVLLPKYTNILIKKSA